MAIAYIYSQRKDGKHKVSFRFDNGRVINKLLNQSDLIDAVDGYELRGDATIVNAIKNQKAESQSYDPFGNYSLYD